MHGRSDQVASAAEDRVDSGLPSDRHLLQTLLDHLPDRIYFKDTQSRFTLVNRAIVELFALQEPSQVIGKTDFDFFMPEHAGEAFADEQSLMLTGGVLVGKVEREVLPDGRRYWVSTTKAPLTDSNGTVVGTFGISRDISSLKLVEEALEKERNLLQGLINSLPDQIYVKDQDSRFILANTALRMFFGVSDEQIVGKTDQDFFPSDAAGSFLAEEREMLRTGRCIVNREARVVDRGGREIWILSTKVPLRQDSGAIIWIGGANRDISDLKVGQANLRQREQDLLNAIGDLRRAQDLTRAVQVELAEAERFKSTGRLAAGVAHEVKNPLAIIALGIEWMGLKAAADWPSEAPTVLKTMQDAVDRANAVVRGLVDFAAPAELNRSPEDLNELVRRSLLLARHELVRHHAVCHEELAEDLPRISVDARKIEQVFVNLIVNAAQAMPTHGTLTVRTRLRTTLEPAADRCSPDVTRAGPENLVLVEFQDTGTGIAEEKIGKVFDPFFTTKPVGQGSGLGLTVSKAIVELHGGTIGILNRSEGGCLVTLTFRVEGDPYGQPSEQADSDRRRRT